MSEELREIVVEIIRNNDLGECDEWVKEIKKWAMGLVPKEKDQTGFLGHNGDDNPQFSDTGYEIMGYNQAIAEMLKKIEESE